MNIKKITKEATIDKVLPNEIVNKIKTTNKDDWKNYYKNLNSSKYSLWCKGNLIKIPFIYKIH